MYEFFIIGMFICLGLALVGFFLMLYWNYQTNKLYDKWLNNNKYIMMSLNDKPKNKEVK